jgi:hypothetical protein
MAIPKHVVSFFLLAGFLGCSQETQQMDKKAPESSAPQAPTAKTPEPDYITVQHCLIAFKGSLPKPTVTRSKDEAKQLAYEVFEKAKKGENFDGLVKQYTDDSPPGIYVMANTGKPPRKPIPQEFPRGRMVAAFGDTGFPLKVGEYGMADYDPVKSPFGWHIVKRIE